MESNETTGKKDVSNVDLSTRPFRRLFAKAGWPLLLVIGNVGVWVGGGVAHKTLERYQARQLDIAAQKQNADFVKLGGFNTVAVSNLTSEQNRIFSIQNQEDGEFSKHHQEFDQSVANSMGKRDPSSLRMQAWRKMADEVRAIENPIVKVQAVHDWVKWSIAYDDDKSDKGIIGPDWLQTPQETLRRGKGVCNDQAALVAETLVRVGFSRSDVKLISMQYYDAAGHEINGHEVTGVKIDGQIWVVDTTRHDGGLVPANEFFNRNEFEDKSYYQPTFVMDLDNKIDGVYSATDDNINNAPAHWQVNIRLSDEQYQLMNKVKNEGQEVGKLPTIPYQAASNAEVRPNTATTRGGPGMGRR